MTKEVGDRAGQGRACGNLSHAYSALDDFQRAKDYYEHCLSIAKEVGDRVGEGHAYYCLGTSLLAEGCLNEALFHFKSSVETIGTISASCISEDVWKISFRKLFKEACNCLWQLLIRLKLTDEALYTVERGRA